MWILTPLQPEGETHYLLSSKEYVVGRKNCDILLAQDQSISRAHAHLTATDQTLTLKDASKYGTFVNSQRLAENTTVELKPGDNITFGVFDSKFSVEHQKPVVCSSCLDNDGKALLSQALAGLGGRMVNSWSQESTHLVMTSVKVTIKTICALLCCRPIVKPEFFSELSKAAQQKSRPPKAESFTPEIDEPSLSKEAVNLRAIPTRRQIFSGKTFIFLSAKQLKRLAAAVSFGGGATRLLEESSLPRELLESPQSCVVDVATGSSQPLLPSDAAEWVKSVRSLVQRTGRRVITESEIGLAAIYASCDHYCNPSGLIPDSESASNINPRIPSATLSQSAAVDETALPAASQNITAYVANTEQQLSTESREVMAVTAVGETPEKKQDQNTDLLLRPKAGAQKTASQCVVAESLSPSLGAAENTDSLWKKPESRLKASRGGGGVRSQPPFFSSGGGPKTFPRNPSPQKQKPAAQTSPQKQSTLTNFFQPVVKKRPLDELFMSEPKRPVLESSMRVPPSNTSDVPKETRSPPQGSAAGFSGSRSEAPSYRVSHAVQEELHSRKRKEMEAEMEELESIMSEDMDCFDESPSDNQSQKAPAPREKEASSASKRQRVQPEETGTNNDLEQESASNRKPKPEQHINVVSIKKEQVDPSEYKAKASQEASKPPAAASAGEDLLPFEDDDASFIEDLEQLSGDIFQPKEESRTPLKPVTVKQEVQESAVDEGLPKKLLLVEFRSLTVAAAPKSKPQTKRNVGNAKNFKRFRKIYVPGAAGSAHVIGGSDLLVHNRGTNTDVDEWLKDAAEEERQSRRDESAGDDLFRYNPTKVRKRR